jgi:Bacterial Ig-like domain
MKNRFANSTHEKNTAMKRFLLLSIPLLIALLSACFTAPTPTTPPADPNDTTPPTVISVDPANGAKAIEEDQVITITFSERMNQAATEAAYQSPSLPPVTFTWNAAGTILTIQPNDPIPYSYQVDTALSYTFSVSGAAKDAAGNSLALLSSSFSTLRAFYTECFGIASLDGQVNSNQSFSATDQFIVIGDFGDNLSSRGFFSFDLTTCIPAGALANKAVLKDIYKQQIAGNPPALGSMLLEHVNYGNSLGADDYNTPVLTNLGIFDSTSAPAGTRIDTDVTRAVQNDLDNRATRSNRSQYRLRFGTDSNNDNNADYVRFHPTEAPGGVFIPLLQVDYLIP